MNMTPILPLVLAAMALQDPVPSPSPSPKSDEIEATIVDVAGTVDVKRPSDKDWGPAQKNMKLQPGSEICTGTSSTATLLFPAGLTIDLRPVSYATLSELVKFAGGMKTNVRLKFGTIDIELKKSEVTAGLTVATPNATTSISGSKGTVTAWAQGGEQFISLKVFTGDWFFISARNGFGGIFGLGEYTNDLGDLPFDLGLLNEVREYSLNPGFEGGFNGLNPFFDAVTQPSTLPGPPPPPP